MEVCCFFKKMLHFWKKCGIIHIYLISQNKNFVKLKVGSFIKIYIGGALVLKYSFRKAPEPLYSFLIYIESIQGKSNQTANEYYYDLKTFYKFLKIHYKLVSLTVDFKEIDFSDLTLDTLKLVDLNVIYTYINFLTRERRNSPASRARKIASLRSFYKYLCNKAHLIETNPTIDLDTVKIGKRLPRYLTLEDSLTLLNAVDEDNSPRDYCIITFFLNCGMRLNELVNINITDIRDEKLTVIGKGNKERTIYLNSACKSALKEYMKIRRNITPHNSADKNALFISKQYRRISRRMVQRIVEKYIKQIGLDSHKYTTHKLRHTAATLMYQSGVDIRALQEILGHEQLSTTEIYTHVNNDQLRNAASSNPLAKVEPKHK